MDNKPITINQFGNCIRCGATSQTMPGGHNIVITEPGKECNYYQQLAYDVCIHCIERILNFLTETDEKDELTNSDEE